eukprot:5423300-Alexandrium_andersonii.AAC.1
MFDSFLRPLALQNSSAVSGVRVAKKYWASRKRTFSSLPAFFFMKAAMLLKEAAIKVAEPLVCMTSLPNAAFSE